MRKLLLAGYIGCGNIGDDAMALGFMEASHGEFDFIVLSGNPESTYNQYKVHSVDRRDMTAVDKAIDACDALVFPGGSIFQDVTSVRSVAYYSQLVKKAKSKGKKVVLLGQGVGPLNRFFGKRMAASAFKAADAISVRDSASASAIKALGVNRPVKLTADCAFLLPKPDLSDGSGGGFKVGDMKTVGLSPRPHGKRGEVAALFGELSRLLFQANYVPVLIEMDRNEDGPLIQEISNSQGGKIPDMKKMTGPQQAQDRIARMDAVIAMRLHAGILAASVGVPPMMISYDPKVDAFARQIGLGAAIPFQGADPKRIFDLFQRGMQDKVKNVAILEKKRDELTRLALENISLLRETVR
jgi:polysaccharide pyruvyl transferase CsaB